MERKTKATLNILVTGANTELGRETTRQLVARGHCVTGLAQGKDNLSAIRADGGLPVEADPTNARELKDALSTAKATVVLNLAPQAANTLLHDGHDWKGFDQTLSVDTLLEVAATQSAFLVHASYAFLYGNAQDATESDALCVPSNDPIFTAGLTAEDQVINSKIPMCVLRLGYLYGPQSADLRKYITSFQLRRPYFAGPEDNLTNWLHFEDAAQALVLVAERQPAGEVFNVVDGTPVSFSNFIDTFALKLGMSKPGHIPLFLAPLARIIIKSQQMELLELSTTLKNDKVRSQLGWRPYYPSYRVGLEQTLKVWRATDVIK